MGRNRQCESRLKVSRIQCRTGERIYERYEVAGKDVDGRRVRRRFKTEPEARHWAAWKECVLQNAPVQRPMLTIMTEGQRIKAEAIISRFGDDALDEAYDLLANLRRPQTEDMEMQDAVDRFLVRKREKGIRPRTLYQLERTLKVFMDYVGEEARVWKISISDCEQFLQAHSRTNKT